MSHFTAKCTKFDFGWGSIPDPTRRAYSAPRYPLAGREGAGCPSTKPNPRSWPFASPGNNDSPRSRCWNKHW